MRRSNVPLGAIVFVLVIALLRLPLPDQKADRSLCNWKQLLYQLDFGGSVLLVAFVSCLFMAMQWGGQRLPWRSPTIIALFTASVLFVFFLLLDIKMGEYASVLFRVLQRRSIAFGCVYLFLNSMPNFSVSTCLI
jgi:hypothetical protein